MVISKLWKDIHPQQMVVENNSICWKNIAPYLASLFETFLAGGGRLGGWKIGLK